MSKRSRFFLYLPHGGNTMGKQCQLIKIPIFFFNPPILDPSIQPFLGQPTISKLLFRSIFRLYHFKNIQLELMVSAQKLVCKICTVICPKGVYTLACQTKPLIFAPILTISRASIKTIFVLKLCTQAEP